MSCTAFLTAVRQLGPYYSSFLEKAMFIRTKRKYMEQGLERLSGMLSMYLCTIWRAAGWWLLRCRKLATSVYGGMVEWIEVTLQGKNAEFWRKKQKERRACITISRCGKSALTFFFTVRFMAYTIPFITRNYSECNSRIFCAEKSLGA